MRRAPKRNGLPVLGAVGAADSGVAASGTAMVAAPAPAVGTRVSAVSRAGKRNGLDRPDSPVRPEQSSTGRMLWLVDQAQHSRNGKKSWLARISSAKRRRSANSANNTRFCTDPTTELMFQTKTIRLAQTLTWTR